jgi:hypothetical protein
VESRDADLVRPREAAVAARAVPGLRRSERALLEQLLRLERDGEVPWRRGTTAIAEDLGYSVRQVERARRALVAAGVVEVVEQGIGATRTQYRIVLSFFRGNHPVNQGENPESPPSLAPTPCRYRPDTMSVPSRHHVGTYTRARSLTPLTPTTPQPPASGGRSLDEQKCPKAAARGQPCPNCRACGTTARQIEAARKRDERSAATIDRLEAQLAARAANEAARAEADALRASRGPSPAYLAAREALTPNQTDREANA